MVRRSVVFSSLLFAMGLMACAPSEPPPVPASSAEKKPESASPSNSQANPNNGPISTSPTKPASTSPTVPPPTKPTIPNPPTPPADPKPPTPPAGGTPTGTTTGGNTPSTPTGGTTTPTPPAGGTTTPPATPPASTAQGYWVAGADGEYPVGALSAGTYDGESSIICRVKLANGGAAPGTLLPSQGVCFYTDGTKGAYSYQYEVLTITGGAAADILDFAAAANGSWPAKSVKGGDNAGRELAICIVATSYGIAYGQVGKGDPGCVFYGMGADGEPVAVYMTSYWVLISKK